MVGCRQTRLQRSCRVVAGVNRSLGSYVTRAVILSSITVAIGGLILASPYRLGVDVQKLLGYPSCLPSLLYILDYSTPVAVPTQGAYAIFRYPATNLGVGVREGQRAIKIVAALPGDLVEIAGTELYLRGMPWRFDRLWLASSIAGKKIGDFDAKYNMPEGSWFAYGTEKESLDSRYFGPVEQSRIVGYAKPLF